MNRLVLVALGTLLATPALAAPAGAPAPAPAPAQPAPASSLRVINNSETDTSQVEAVAAPTDAGPTAAPACKAAGAPSTSGPGCKSGPTTPAAGIGGMGGGRFRPKAAPPTKTN